MTKSHGFKSAIIFSFSIAQILMLASCRETHQPEENDLSYINAINKWHEMRIKSLTSEDGWLSLAGLFWLKEGDNSFGADGSNDIVFPKDKAPDFIGSFILDDGEVKIRIRPGLPVLHGQKLASDMILQDDETGEPTILTYGSLSWYVIKRDGRYGIRLKDSDNPRIKEFKGIDRFPVSRRWRIKASYQPYDPPKKISLPTVLGTIIEEPSPGSLRFKIHGQTYQLDAFGEADDEELFVIFADQTNGFETYGGGRFLSVKRPDEEGRTYIDFNKAYNPPCAFTEFATCPLPPTQNKLSVRITAGEKKYRGASH